MNRHNRRALRASPQGKSVHQDIAEAAKGLAALAYDQIARNNEFYKANRSEKAFVAQHWARFVPLAREALVDLMGDEKADPALREEAFDAFCLDAAINPPVEHAERAVGLIN